MGEELYRREAPHIPTEERALARLQLAVERGELQELPTLAGIRGIQGVLPRYLVTYMNSQTTNNAMRAATVVSVSNRAPLSNRVVVTFFKGWTDDSAPVGTAAFTIPTQFSVNFASRHLPDELTVTSAVPSPELTYDEGRAIVLSEWPYIAVSARVYYTAGDRDETLHAITDSKVVVYDSGNQGD